MTLNPIYESLLLAAYFRGGNPTDEVWSSNADQVVTLSLFYTGDISSDDCESRFINRRYIGCLYDSDGELNAQIASRYHALIELIHGYSDLIQGGGDLQTPADPTFTACRLTNAGCQMALSLVASFPSKPSFPQWPDRKVSTKTV